MNNFSREIISDIHQLVSKAKAFENQLEPLANLYNEVKSMTEQLEDLNAKVLDIETNINKGGIEADDLRHILTDAFNRVTETELLSFSLDEDNLERAFKDNATDDIEVRDAEFDIQSGNEIILEDYNLDYDDVRWSSVAEDIQFDADFDDEALTGLIDRIIDKVCPSSQDVPSEMLQEDGHEVD
tara:strand:- start:2028 stop:2579 length:552 start_codon:yes stop_codon:yes gene_type:complete